MDSGAKFHSLQASLRSSSEDPEADERVKVNLNNTEPYQTLLPPNTENLAYSDIIYHMANYFIPLHEVESYSLEFSGMLGDLGLYIPIVVLLSLNGQINLATTLTTTGLSNIMTGLLFKVPMCVQPMKSIAAAALAENLTEGEIMAAGILTAGIVMALGATNLITIFDAMIPKPVVRGLQIGLGLSMFHKGLNMLPGGGASPSWGHEDWVAWNGLLPAGITLLFALVTAKAKSVPVAFIVFLAGAVVAAASMVDKGVQWDSSLLALHLVLPTKQEWLTGLYRGALPQIPTTLLNSCIAVCKLSENLYPERETGLTLRGVSSSVGAINLLFCWVGGYPMCHGSGGLAGQHRFGARTNLSIIVLGSCKLLLGVFCGAGLLSLLRFFPNALLAALLAVASWELSVSGREGLQGSIEDARLCILTAAFVTFWGQGTGIVLGLLVAYSLLVADACFGTPEDVGRGRQRLRDNAQLLGRLGRDVWKSWCGRGEGGGRGE